jgi:hypothetical protein
VVECVYHWSISDGAKGKDWKMFRAAMKVALSENEIPKEA